MEKDVSAQILIPVPTDEFWKQMRLIIREEIAGKTESAFTASGDGLKVDGLTYKPLFKMEEVCRIFQVTRPTIYDWIKHGKLKPYKIRSRVYFLHSDISQLLPFK